jgi:hypothetical protein
MCTKECILPRSAQADGGVSQNRGPYGLRESSLSLTGTEAFHAHLSKVCSTLKYTKPLLDPDQNQGLFPRTKEAAQVGLTRCSSRRRALDP